MNQMEAFGDVHLRVICFSLATNRTETVQIEQLNHEIVAAVSL
jgi:hypothetical protein